MDVQLNFINNSNDQNNSKIVVFPTNVIGAEGLAAAWLVIENCGIGDSHPFVYPEKSQVGIMDSWGNHSPKLDARPGQAFAVAKTSSGDELSASGEATHPAEIQVANNLEDKIEALIFKDDRLFASRPVAPHEMVAFEFEPTIWIGVVYEIVEGSVTTVAETANQEFSLLGIVSADIVLTGGANTGPFNFTLENAIRA